MWHREKEGLATLREVIKYLIGLVMNFEIFLISVAFTPAVVLHDPLLTASKGVV